MKNKMNQELFDTLESLFGVTATADEMATIIEVVEREEKALPDSIEANAIELLKRVYPWINKNDNSKMIIDVREFLEEIDSHENIYSR